MNNQNNNLFKPLNPVTPSNNQNLKTDDESMPEIFNEKKFDISVSEKNEKISSKMPIIKIFETILNMAAEKKASDIHIEPQQKNILIRFRIDGFLQEIATLPKELEPALLSRIKIMSGLRIDEQRKPQDGRIHFNFANRNLDVRISIVPTLHGSKIALRLLEDKNQEFAIDNLGLSEKELAIVKKQIRKPYGLILVTGPTSSGKTTTLYNLLNQLADKGLNITTIEDPIEYGIPGVNQIQTNPAINFSFAEGLKTILRQDPDIIMVGEIRDKETARLAINAALTGHLVFSSIHTNSAAGAIPRLLEMGIEPFMLAASLNMIIAQRLVRKNCQHCLINNDKEKESFEKITKKLNLDINENNIKIGQGCEKCLHTGYKGRSGIFEVMPLDESFHELIYKKASVQEIERHAIANGMNKLLVNGLIKVAQGKTTLNEIIRVTKQ